MTSSAVSSPTPRYSSTARWLHWLSASLIVWATLSGLAVSLFLKDTAIAHGIADMNVSATLVFIPFFIWRIAHRLRQGVPDYDATLTETNQRAALGVHYVLYGLTAMVLLSGVLMMNRPFSIFYLIELSPLLTSQSGITLFETLHVCSSRLLGLLVVLHIAAVVKHQLANKRILERML